jgi:hypothetical protein
MEIEKHITLHLTQAESDALKKLLGKHSGVSKKKLGLTDDESELTSQMYDQLTNPDEGE